MKKITLFSLLLLFIADIQNLAAQVKVDSLTNEELRQMFNADQAERSGGIQDWQELVRKDSLRRERVRLLLESEQVRTPADYYHAAMIFQHGTDTLDSGMAVKLMREAVALDTTMNKWLLAAAIDRDLMRKGKPQIYGTQYVKNGADQPFELYQLDSTQITDEERREYNVRTLAEQRQQVILMNKKSLLQLAAEGKPAEEIIDFIKGNRESQEYDLSETAINSLGYYYMNQKEYQAALGIFELNIELFPQAFNTYDSYGEILLLLGREKEAVAAYERSLELNPENGNAREVLGRLGAESGK